MNLSMKVVMQQVLSRTVQHRRRPMSYRTVLVGIEQLSIAEMKNDGDVVRVRLHTDDVDEDLNENDDVKERDRFERNCNHDEKQFVFQYV